MDDLKTEEEVLRDIFFFLYANKICNPKREKES